jgi:excisionase family DNA binding protein
VEEKVPEAVHGTQPPGLEWLSLGPASRLLGVDPDTLRRWADSGRVRSFSTPGGHRRFARTDIGRLRHARRPARETLSKLGATRERLSRAYARSYRDGIARPVAGGVEPTDREVFRFEGRRIVECLVAYLDAASVKRKAALESEATEIIEATARRLAASGIELVASIDAFMAARRPFLAELESLGRRRALEAGAVMHLYAAAAALLDRLLLRFVTAFQHTRMED